MHTFISHFTRVLRRLARDERGSAGFLWLATMVVTAVVAASNSGALTTLEDTAIGEQLTAFQNETGIDLRNFDPLALMHEVLDPVTAYQDEIQSDPTYNVGG